MWQEFGAWIRKQRRAADLTQKAVAAGIGLSHMQIVRIEGGQGGTRRETVEALARFLELDSSEALLRAGFAEPSEATRLILAKLRHLPPETIREVERFIDFIAESGNGDTTENDPRQKVRLKKIDERQPPLFNGEVQPAKFSASGRPPKRRVAKG